MALFRATSTAHLGDAAYASIPRPDALRFAWMKDKRLVLMLLCTLIGAVLFWGMSRYPALEHKASLSGVITMQDSLVHIATVENLTVTDGWARIQNSFINWVMANRRGMLFGVLIGAAFLTMLRYLPRFTSQHPVANSLYGMAAGSPLGVCSNCVAPIMKGIYESGRRAELALAMMFSSPTLNIIVVTMVFSIFPLEIALLKIAVTLVLVVVYIPILTRLLPLKAPVKKQHEAQEEMCALSAPRRAHEGWGQAARGAVMDYASNLRYIALRTVPLMFVAGALGALMAHIVPLDAWAGRDASFMQLAGASLLGTFLPMPVAVDVMFAHSFLNGGASAAFVMVMLVTLGSYSVYSFAIVWQTMGLRMAVALFVSVAALGMGAGLLVHLLT